MGHIPSELNNARDGESPAEGRQNFWRAALTGLIGITLLLTLALGGSGFQDPKDLPHAFEAGWKGEKTCELLFEDDSVRVGRCTFPPGAGHEKHFHRPHFGYTLTPNTMEIRSADGVRVNRAKSGDSWETDSITIHEALNIGDTTAVYLIVEPKP